MLRGRELPQSKSKELQKAFCKLSLLKARAAAAALQPFGGRHRAARRAGAPAAAQPGSPLPTLSPAPERFLGCFPGFHQRAAARHRRERQGVPQRHPRSSRTDLRPQRRPPPGLSRPLAPAEGRPLRKAMWSRRSPERGSDGSSDPSSPISRLLGASCPRRAASEQGTNSLQLQLPTAARALAAQHRPTARHRCLRSIRVPAATPRRGSERSFLHYVTPRTAVFDGEHRSSQEPNFAITESWDHLSWMGPWSTAADLLLIILTLLDTE